MIRDLIESIEENDFREEVEIIGWMYQYYISEKKDEVFAALKKNKKITKENIPAATQLFTPKWIVKYMTENSLGRLWQESHPNEDLKSNWEYYVEPTEQVVEVRKKLDELKNPNLSPEEIKILDPAMGSGHILVYAFDVLYDIYLSRGYAERDIPQLILEKNLFGLDIDDRAAQLASFALLMKARSKNRRFFGKHVSLNVYSIKESNGFSAEALEYLVNPSETQIEKVVHLSDVKYLIDLYKDAKDYGSILNVKKIDTKVLCERVNEIDSGHNLDIFEFGYRNEIINLIPDLIKQTEIMTDKYDVVITNPPYMGKKGMGKKLSSYIQKNFPDEKNDLFAVFIKKGLELTKNGKYVSMVTMQSWLFIKSFLKLRRNISSSSCYSSLLQIGFNSFPEMNSQIAHACSFVLHKGLTNGYKGKYFNLNNESITSDKGEVFLNRKSHNKFYIKTSSDFEVIPDGVIAYWISPRMLDIYKNEKRISDYSTVTNGLFTCNNNYFLKLWHEISVTKCNLKCTSKKANIESDALWYPYNKGGSYRKWYGNHEYVVRFKNFGDEIKHYRLKSGQSASFPGSENYFNKSISWSFISTASFTVRYYPEGFVFDIAGSSIFTSDSERYYMMGFLMTKIVNELLRINPTVNFQAGNIAELPYISVEDLKLREEIERLCKSCINIARDDWNSYETSWDYQLHPLVRLKRNSPNISKVDDLIFKWIDYKNMQIEMIRSYEQQLNSIFIEIYKLEDELSPEIKKKDITITEGNAEMYIESLISYFVGCCFGRYSLDQEGVVFAGGHFDKSKYTKLTTSEDNVLLISEDDYFENDILNRFVEFLKVVFGIDMLEVNLKYIADVINPKSKGTSRQTIRNYFAKDFYKDHCKTYKKRPIYWMIDSGKYNGIKALFYMHRYDKSTIARFRTDYLHEIQRYYENDIELTEKTNDKKRVDKLKKKLQEVTEFDKVVAHIAHQQIEFDLDDGVEHNYELFQGIEVPQGDGQKPLKANLLAKRK